MNQNYKESFQFSRKEVRGIVALLFICLLLFLASNFIDMWYNLYSPRKEELVHVKKIALEVLEKDVSGSVFRTFEQPKLEKIPKLYYFDPNTIEVKSWMEFGLSEKQAGSIRAYISKGGRFYRPEDLEKMYVINSNLYKKLRPYVRIEKELRNKNESVVGNLATNKVSTLSIININLADSLQLLDLKGIGPTFARRIITYRNRLGGFVNASQLLEVYGFDTIRLNTILPRLKFGNDLTLIDLNTITFDELRKHPYLSYSQAQAVIQYRVQHGTYKSKEDLLRVKALDTGVLRRLSPYLLF